MKRARLRSDEGGQVIVFSALILFVLVCVLVVTFDVGSLVHKRISLQNAADASAVSGAAWEARGLNLIASLNQGIVTMFGIMTAYVVVTGISAYCFPALGSQLVRCAPDVLITLYTIAGEMAKIEKKVVSVTPYLTEGEAVRIADADSPRAVAVPYPFIPGNPHDRQENLGLHVRKGRLKEVVRKILDMALEVIPKPVRDALDTEPTKSFVKDPFYKALEATADSFDFDDSGGMSFEETKIVTFERGKEDAGYDKFADFLKEARAGTVKVTPGSQLMVYTKETFTLDPSTCKESSEGASEQTMKFRSLAGWGPSNPVSDDINSGNIPREQDYIRKETWKKKDRCAGMAYKREEWGFLRFRAEVKKKRTISREEVDTPPIPLFTDNDFSKNQWLAVIVWDTGESRTAPLLDSVFSGMNVWGALTLSQAKPHSPTTGDGEMLWDTDWEPRLTPFTAHEALASHLGKGSKIGALAGKLILH